MQGTRWTHGQIPKSLDSVIPPLVQRVNKGRLRFEVGDSSLGPRPSGPHIDSHNTERMQDDLSHLGLDGGLATNSVLDSPNDSLGPHQAFEVEPQTQSDPEADSLGPGRPLPFSTQSDPGPRLSIQSGQYSKKRLRKEFNRFGRNLRQRLLCGFFVKKGNGSDQSFNEEVREEISGSAQIVDQPQDGLSFVHPNGLWEAIPNQLL